MDESEMVVHLAIGQGPFLLTWINFDPSMDK